MPFSYGRIRVLSPSQIVTALLSLTLVLLSFAAVPGIATPRDRAIAGIELFSACVRFHYPIRDECHSDCAAGTSESERARWRDQSHCRLHAALDLCANLRRL